MSMVYDIATYLAAQGVGTVGTDIFVNSMPDAPDACIGIFQYAGLPPLRFTEVERPGLQVRVRGGSEDDQTAETLMNTIFEKLYDLRSMTINSHNYKAVEPAGSFNLIGRDGKKRLEMSCNFTVIKDI